MRLVATYLAAAAAVASIALAPAQATTKTVHVPVLGCDVVVEVSDVTLTLHHRRAGIYRTGDTGASTNC